MFITLNLEYIVWFTAELVYMRYGSYSLDTSFFAFKCALPSFCIISARGDSCSRLSSRRRSLCSSSQSKQVVFFSYKSALLVCITDDLEVALSLWGIACVYQIPSFFTFKLVPLSFSNIEAWVDSCSWLCSISRCLYLSVVFKSIVFRSFNAALLSFGDREAWLQACS